MKNYRIVFMGTPDFAVPALQSLHAAGHEIALAVTQPDRPKGRGRKVEPPPVKEAAAALGVPVVQPATLRDEATLQTLKNVGADFFIVVAFGHLLRESVLEMPRLGCINVHASLLPKYRGPAPIHWTVINDEKETGVTAMLIDKGLDTGDILMTATEAVARDDTSGTLHDRLAHPARLCRGHVPPGRPGPQSGDLCAPSEKNQRPDRLEKAGRTHRALHPGHDALARRLHVPEREAAQGLSGRGVARARQRTARNGHGRLLR
jgi:hypothetical protein